MASEGMDRRRFLLGLGSVPLAGKASADTDDRYSRYSARERLHYMFSMEAPNTDIRMVGPNRVKIGFDEKGKDKPFDLEIEKRADGKYDLAWTGRGAQGAFKKNIFMADVPTFTGEDGEKHLKGPVQGLSGKEYFITSGADLGSRDQTNQISIADIYTLGVAAAQEQARLSPKPEPRVPAPPARRPAPGTQPGPR